MPTTETRYYRSQACHRPIFYDGHWWAWGRVPAIPNIYSIIGLDGDWARWVLFQLDEELGQVWQSAPVELERFTPDEPTAPIKPDNTSPAMSMRDMEGYNDPHANPYAALCGKYLLFCPAPECQLICWDLDEKVETWRKDARRHDNLTTTIFRILLTNPGEGLFAVSFRERIYLEQPLTDLIYNPTWGEDEDTVNLAPHSADLESPNTSPCGVLILDAATGAEEARWDVEEIEPELYSQFLGESRYEYTEPTTENLIYGGEAAEYLEILEAGGCSVANPGDFELGGNQPDSINGQQLGAWRPFKNFPGPAKVRHDGIPWQNCDVRMSGTGQSYRRVWSGANYQVTIEDSIETEEFSGPTPTPHSGGYPGSTYYHCSATITSVLGFSEPYTEILNPVGMSPNGSGTGELTVTYPNVPTDELYIDGTGVSPDATTRLWTATGVSADLPNPLDPAIYPDISIPYLGVPAAIYARDLSAFSDPDNGFQIGHTVVKDWYIASAVQHPTSIECRLYVKKITETPLPGALPSHSLSLNGGTSFGFVLGPSTADRELALVWKSFNWDGAVRWTRTIANSLPRRQVTAPVSIGGRVLTVVQEYQPGTTAGDVRVITLDADDGSVILDDPIDPDRFGGFSFDDFAAGCHIQQEAHVRNKKFEFVVNGRLVTY